MREPLPKSRVFPEDDLVRCLPGPSSMTKAFRRGSFLAALMMLTSPVLIHGSTPPAPAQRYDNYQVPAGAALILQLRTPLDSSSSQVDEQVEATLRSPVIQDGVELIPTGSVVIGKLSEVSRASARKPRGRVAFAFTIVEHADTDSRARIRTREVVFEAALEAKPDGGRMSKPSRKPVEVVIPSGETFVAMLAEPLLVRIPRPERE